MTQLCSDKIKALKISQNIPEVMLLFFLQEVLEGLPKCSWKARV